MTENQRKRLYFPAWGRAFAANWSWAGKRLTRTAPDSEWNTLVETTAERHLGPECRATTPDDLRHAANALAVARASGHRREPRREGPARAADFVDRYDLSLGLFVVLCGLLEDPDTLGNFRPPSGRLAWTDPGLIERHYILGSMERRCRESYVVRLVQDITRGQVSSPDDLDLPRLKAVWRTLGQRGNAWTDAAPVEARPF
jgi:hypothetical protein